MAAMVLVLGVMVVLHASFGGQLRPPRRRCALLRGRALPRPRGAPPPPRSPITSRASAPSCLIARATRGAVSRGTPCVRVWANHAARQPVVAVAAAGDPLAAALLAGRARLVVYHRALNRFPGGNSDCDETRYC